jgi:hypothetical protein
LCKSTHTLSLKLMTITKQPSWRGNILTCMWEVSRHPRSNISYPGYSWMCGFSRSLQVNLRISFPKCHSHSHIPSN